MLDKGSRGGCAMIIKSNMDAIRSRNQLRANDKQLAKDLKKISSGQKINSAEDGASEYSIGKKMDVMIRSLDQDIDNSKTGRNLVATADGGIQEIVNNLQDANELLSASKLSKCGDKLDENDLIAKMV